jgi:serpin B
MFLPDEGNYSAFEDSLSGTFISSIYDSLEYAFVHVQIPRFHITTELKLNNALHSMGMVSAFSSGADFSGIDGTDDGMPWISYVQHKTTMFLNEYGTCVYSMTGISLTVGIHPYFKANRPFIFAIIDEPTGVILFLGRVLDANGYPFPFI